MSANQVLAGKQLYVGDWADAQTFDGERLCVLEGAPNYPGMTWHVPILRPPTGAPAPTGTAYVSKAQLQIAIFLIHMRIEDGKKLLVHCAAGVERSPLTCAWFLRHYYSEHFPTLAIAYQHLKAIRPAVIDRTEWLEPKVAAP
jgi:hypothetical protein